MQVHIRLSVYHLFKFVVFTFPFKNALQLTLSLNSQKHILCTAIVPMRKLGH